MSLQTWNQTLVTSQVDGAAITALGPTSILPPAAVITLPNNFFLIGTKLRINAQGRLSQAITTPGTLRFDVRLGGTVVFDSLAMVLETSAAHTNMPWLLEIELICRAIGNGTVANLFGSGKFFYEGLAQPTGVTFAAAKPSFAALLPWNTAPAVGAGFNSTAALSVDVQFTQTVTTGSLTCHMYELISSN